MEEDHRSDQPASLLVDHLSELPKGRALDVAMGYGRNALYLAAQGYRVVGLDRSAEAVSHCRSEAERRGVSLEVHQIDLEGHRLDPEQYDLISCFYYLDRTLFPEIKRALRQGGMVVYETFLIDQHRRYGKPGRAAFCLEHNELLKAFSDLRIRFYQEGEFDGTFLAKLIAEKI